METDPSGRPTCSTPVGPPSCPANHGLVYPPLIATPEHEAEISVAVDPRPASKVAYVATIQSTVLPGARQAAFTGKCIAHKRIEVLRTADLGQHWDPIPGNELLPMDGWTTDPGVTVDHDGTMYLVVLRWTGRQGDAIVGGSVDCDTSHVDTTTAEVQVWFAPPPTAAVPNPALRPALPLGLGAAGDQMPAMQPKSFTGTTKALPSGSDTDHPKIVASPAGDGRVVVFVHDSVDFVATFQRDATGNLMEIGNRFSVGQDAFLALAMDNAGDLYLATANGPIFVERRHWDGTNWTVTKTGDGQDNGGRPSQSSVSGSTVQIGTNAAGAPAFSHGEATPALAVLNFDPTSDPIVYLAYETNAEGGADREIAVAVANGTDLRFWNPALIVQPETAAGLAFSPSLSGDGTSNILDLLYFDREPAAGGGAALSATEIRTQFVRLDASRVTPIYNLRLSNHAPLVSDLPSRWSLSGTQMQLFTGEYSGLATKGTTAIAAWPERPDGATGTTSVNSDLGLASLGESSECTATMSGALMVFPDNTWDCTCQCGNTTILTLGCAAASFTTAAACDGICGNQNCGQGLSCVPTVCSSTESAKIAAARSCAMSDGPIRGAPVASTGDFTATASPNATATIHLSGTTSTTPLTGQIYMSASTSPPRAGSVLEIARLAVKPADVFLGGSIEANLQHMVITHHSRIHGVFTDATHFRIDPGEARLILTAVTQVGEDPPSAPFNLGGSNSAPATGTLDLAAGTIALDTTASDGLGNAVDVSFRGGITSRPPDSDHDGIIDAVDKCPGSVTAPDRTPPVFTFVPPAITLTRCSGVSIGKALATDPCGVTVTSDAPAKFGLGTTVVRWTARDGAGNVSIATQLVTAVLGDDSSCCPAGTNIIIGTSNNDVLTGTSGADCILGRGGQDRLTGGGGNDFISGGDGDDTIFGNDGNDRLYGGTGQDVISGGLGNDFISGGDGVDQLNGDDGDDQISGGQGGDIIRGGAGNDRLNGDDDDDQLFGGDGNDVLSGDRDNDRLFGENGNDVLFGGDGDDTLDGGSGQNRLDAGDGHNQCIDNGVPLTCPEADFD
jgi:Ca2+-binding RTX toxin-like protein